MRSIGSVVPVIIILTLFCIPSVHAQETSIANIQYPKSLIYDLDAASTIPPAKVTATISYSGAQPGYYLQAGVFQLNDGSLAKGSASASPENCVQNISETDAACTIPVTTSAGAGNFSFLLTSRPQRLWDLILVAVLANRSLSILDNSESDYSFTIDVSVALTLQIMVPNLVTVSIDGANHSEGNIKLPLVTGSHNVTVPEIVQVNNDTRLKFEGWSDGETSANRTVLLDHDVNLEANYTQQYLLTINSPAAVSGDGWYDKGTNATFSVNSTMQPMVGVLGYLGGRLEFQGWYDNDQLMTVSETGSILMNASHSIQARWYGDYAVPVGLIISTLILLSYAIVSLKRKHQLKLERRARRKHLSS